ncbi:hypothetical protein GCM10023211_23640 [Orbus sasakiae]|uniref:Uncharacterized protein n=1 Tax=Orbus sasakiae TaxID=1078475 RepID=A0ABP9NCE7_9GAMM
MLKPSVISSECDNIENVDWTNSIALFGSFTTRLISPDTGKASTHHKKTNVLIYNIKKLNNQGVMLLSIDDNNKTRDEYIFTSVYCILSSYF